MDEFLWMVRAGSNSVFYEDFIAKNVVAIGFDRLGDLSNIKDHEALMKKAQIAYDGYKKAQISNYANQVSNFLFEIEKGDYVITYDSYSRLYMVGNVTEDYEYNPKLLEEMPNIRKVKWLKSIPRDSLSNTTKNSLGAIQTLFQPRDSAKKEILSILEGKETVATDQQVIVEPDTSPREVVEQAEEFIKDKIVGISWQDMQELVAGILRAMGYRTRVSPPGPDRGVDIIASPDALGLTQPRIFVEVKHRERSSIGPKDIRYLIAGRNPQQDKCLYVSTGGFTKDAKLEADRSNTPLTLVDLDMLVELLLQYYENLDSETKAIIPLKKIYWPQM